ncbi:MAG: peptidyl-prolyl isomerase [Candidatus Berkelbacteria bacterium Licking1014_85]|uniref:Peptidyl-prolyl cis-trans isomerase n=1 Tax=Candidatus Berkelbacteria bacterium Licking1014_85 TaxID=2017148 RepID=A0A554LHS6_9BACT|nr:MAG: peptidyl-prolyl isomerase [Candidatus Berkelbacteria bacterium Licking1014_85]
MKNTGWLLGLIVIIFAIIFWPKTSNNTITTTTTSGVEVTGLKKYSFPGILPKEKIEGKTAIIATEKGIIRIELFASEAPKTVSNFIYLAQNGFYNGLTFHRVEPGFVIQGGDPKGNGTGDPGYKFEDEKVVRDYDAGIVAMANSGPNTNGSQFFIMFEDNKALPKQYTIFGKVLSGMEVVRAIKISDKMQTITIE